MKSEPRTVPADRAYETLRALKGEGYNVLIDLTAVDYSAFGGQPVAMGWEENFPSGAPASLRKERFEVVYRLACLDAATGLESGPRVEVHCPVGAEPVLRSVMGLWPCADWLEREVWDMFGIGFTDRPGLKRLLLYEAFEGHPLRKDYPISKRQPLIGPESGRLEGAPTLNINPKQVAFE